MDKYKRLQEIGRKYWKQDLCCYSNGRHIGGHQQSYHDLFSKDSGFMEAVEWKDKGKIINVTQGELTRSLPSCLWEYHAMIMGPVTAEEKIDYLLQNIKTTDG